MTELLGCVYLATAVGGLIFWHAAVSYTMKRHGHAPWPVEDWDEADSRGPGTMMIVFWPVVVPLFGLLMFSKYLLVTLPEALAAKAAEAEKARASAAAKPPAYYVVSDGPYRTAPERCPACGQTKS